MNSELLHPLMFVRALDAPTRRRGHGRRSGRGLSSFNGSSNSMTGRVPPARGRGRSLTHSSKARSQSLSEDLALSESDSENDEEKVVPRRSTRISRSLLSISTLEPEDSNEEGEGNSETPSLMDDLKMSSDSSDSSSVSTEDSEITGPSDSESDDSYSSKQAAESLTGTLKGDSYFSINKKVDPTVYLDFKITSLTDDSTLVFNRFKILCRDYGADQAGLMFADKLKLYPTKKIITLLQEFWSLFKKECFIHIDMEPLKMFGCIVLSLVYYWYAKQMHEVNIKLLKLLEFYHIDPLRLRRFCKADDNTSILEKVTISNEIEVTLVCCETYFAVNDMKHCVKFLNMGLRKSIEENSKSELEYVMPLVKRVFSKLIATSENRPLMVLFCYILDVQCNLEHPIDISLYYEGLLAILVAKSSENKLCYKQAWEVVDKVNYWCYAEASGIVYRGLLMAAALRNEEPARVTSLVLMCVNTYVYPVYDTSKWAITFYSSMTKIEMQIYLLHCLRAYLLDIQCGYLKMCSTFLTFEVLPVSNITRDYVHPVHLSLKGVDHSLPGAILRLKKVVSYYMERSADECLHFDGRKFIMFAPVVMKFFKKVLKLERIEKDTESCVLCGHA